MITWDASPELRAEVVEVKALRVALTEEAARLQRDKNAGHAVDYTRHLELLDRWQRKARMAVERFESEMYQGALGESL